MPSLLNIKSLSKTFPGQRALDSVDVHLGAGEVHALCGQNGSGKSTLIKILAGFHDPDPGAQLSFLGEDLLARHGRAAVEHRMHFIHQDLGLIGSLDAAENLQLNDGRHAMALARPRSLYRKTERRLGELGIDLDVRVPVATLKPVERCMIAIARAIGNWADGPGLLVLDEPTAALPGPEVDRLFESVRRIRERGAAILYVTHKLEEVFEISDRVTVLRDGRLVSTGDTQAFTRATLIKAMLGDEASESPKHLTPSRAPGEVRLRVENLTGGELSGLSFDVRAGEVVGITGLIGSGVEVLAEAIYAGSNVESGTVSVDGERLDLLGPRESLSRGLALVPSDRHAKGCIPKYSIRENVTLPQLKSVTGVLGVSRAGEQRDVAAWAERVELQPGSLERPMSALSGGNQQKVVVARSLRLSPKVLILDEPTQGVDVGAKAAMTRLLRNAAHDDGGAVLVIATDTEMLVECADRILILSEGSLVDEVPRRDASVHSLNVRLLRC